MNIQTLEPTRDQLWTTFWEAFYSKLTTRQRLSWGQRKPEIENFFKQAWNSGAQSVLDLLQNALEKRNQVILDHNVELQLARTGDSRQKHAG